MRLTYIYRVKWYSAPVNDVVGDAQLISEQLIDVRANHLSMADQAIQEFAFNRPHVFKTEASFLLKTADEIIMIALGEDAGRAKVSLRA